MKKILSLIIVIGLVTNNTKAQLSVYSNGNVGVATSSSAASESTFSVKGSKTGYEAAVIGTERGIYSQSNGQSLNWSYAMYGKSNCSSAIFQNGVTGRAEIVSPQSSCRTYGVVGIAGNATNGWNYGIFGQLNGTNKGAGVYGTATNGENGSYVDGRYAGYFNGPTKVKGNLTVTGAIDGVLLSQASNSSAEQVLSDEAEDNITERLSSLTTIRYYTRTSAEERNVLDNSSDSISTVVPANELQSLSESRIHYGLDINVLKDFFPELVYEQKDGSTGINYIEMIPILVQAINNLREEIKVLKAESSSTYSNRSNSRANSILLGTDGKIIGIKSITSK